MHRTNESDIPPVPVILFVYKRAEKLRAVLGMLKKNGIPLLIVFSDAPRSEAEARSVDQVRDLIRSVDWCQVDLRCARKNRGLGRSIRRGVTSVLKEYGRAVVFEDDIECVEGTYRYLCAALEQYQNDHRVLSISAWTHPQLRPPLQGAPGPYFDGRFCCWGWATWRRAWHGMQVPALLLGVLCRLRGGDPGSYGGDLVNAAREEFSRNIWAVRFCMLHFLRRGLSYHPQESLTNHMGFDDSTTTGEQHKDDWVLPALTPCQEPPDQWPEPMEDPETAARWRAAHPPAAPFHSYLLARLQERRWRISGSIRRAIANVRRRS